MGQNIKSLAACVCVCVRVLGAEYLENLDANISKTVRDTGSVTMGHPNRK